MECSYVFSTPLSFNDLSSLCIFILDMQEWKKGEYCTFVTLPESSVSWCLNIINLSQFSSSLSQFKVQFSLALASYAIKSLFHPSKQAWQHNNVHYESKFMAFTIQATLWENFGHPAQLNPCHSFYNTSYEKHPIFHLISVCD